MIKLHATPLFPLRIITLLHLYLLFVDISAIRSSICLLLPLRPIFCHHVCQFVTRFTTFLLILLVSSNLFYFLTFIIGHKNAYEDDCSTDRVDIIDERVSG